MQEDYVIKTVDVFSGLGGALGLWLGFSVVSIGFCVIKGLKTVKTIKFWK